MDAMVNLSQSNVWYFVKEKSTGRTARILVARNTIPRARFSRTEASILDRWF